MDSAGSRRWANLDNHIRRTLSVLSRSPISREITEEVPPHYVAQIQVLMEILDLRATHFIQYRPEGPFSGQEFQLTEVWRDRQWFADALPTMRAFMADWRALEGDPDAHQKILGTRRRASRKEVEVPTVEELWAAVPTRACPFLDAPSAACEDPFGEAAAAARSRLLTEAVAVAVCPFSEDVPDEAREFKG